MDDQRPDSRPPERRPSTLLSIAVTLIIVGLVVSILTPFKLFILFLPIGLAPIIFSVRKK